MLAIATLPRNGTLSAGNLEALAAMALAAADGVEGASLEVRKGLASLARFPACGCSIPSRQAEADGGGGSGQTLAPNPVVQTTRW